MKNKYLQNFIRSGAWKKMQLDNLKHHNTAVGAQFNVLNGPTLIVIIKANMSV